MMNFSGYRDVVVSFQDCCCQKRKTLGLRFEEDGVHLKRARLPACSAHDGGQGWTRINTNTGGDEQQQMGYTGQFRQPCSTRYAYGDACTRDDHYTAAAFSIRRRNDHIFIKAGFWYLRNPMCIWMNTFQKTTIMYA